MVNSRRRLKDEDKKDLLELAKTHGLTPKGMQEIFDMMDTEHLPDSSFHPNPEVSHAIERASPLAIEVYGNLQLKRIDRSLGIE